ncbi:MAG TPA: hypothetical protein VFJ57_11970 [Solirubrobacterales bacterium]|nr:hypothetical protein [Solirubrobacterales bacterium]
MARIVLPITFAADGLPVGGEALVSEAGPSVLVFTSASASLGIELRSAYLEGERSASVLVAESGVIGGEPAELRSRLLRVGESALTFERRALLYDHLQALQDLAERAGHQLALGGVDAAAGELDPHLRIRL